jgi:hypothetical protein
MRAATGAQERRDGETYDDDQTYDNQWQTIFAEINIQSASSQDNFQPRSLTARASFHHTRMKSEYEGRGKGSSMWLTT